MIDMSRFTESGRRYVSTVEINHKPENIKEVELRYLTGFMGDEDSFCVKDVRFTKFAYLVF